jgi:hypothetical protein
MVFFTATQPLCPLGDNVLDSDINNVSPIYLINGFWSKLWSLIYPLALFGGCGIGRNARFSQTLQNKNAPLKERASR